MLAKNADKTHITAKLNHKKIMLAYTILSILLFVFGDKIIFSLSTDGTTLFIMHSAKDILLLLISACFFYYLLNLYHNTFHTITKELTAATIEEEKKQAFLAAMPDALFHLNKQGAILDFFIPDNMVFPQKFSFTPAQIGQNIALFFSPHVAEKNLAVIQQTLEARKIQYLEYEYPVNDKTMHWEARYVPYCEDEILVFVRNTTKNQYQLEKLKQLSIHDKTTGLTNRTYFELQLERLQDTKYYPVGVLVCSIEYLKLLNITLGQESDDILLHAVSILKKSLPSAVSISRIGSDEFVIFFKNTSAAQIEEASLALRDNEAAYNTANPSSPISISLGQALTSDQDDTISKLVDKADYAMYCDKLERSKEVRDLFLQALLLTLQQHDQTAQNRFANMQQLIERFARACQLSEQTIQELKWLALFHDIGKIGVSSQILNKEDRLTPDELNEIKKHCNIGYQIARVIPSLMPIADLISKHHEWWDGKGYPSGLKAEQIPLECRILAIVDAFIAMTSERPYRPAKSASEALLEIQKCAGSQFDPELADKFLNLM